MISRRTGLRLLAAATALTAFAAPATAQRIDRIVAFGDSYADTGIATSIFLASPLTPPSTKALIQQLYPTGRFSGGTNYIDTLSTLLDAPVVNFAIGGALTNNYNTNFGPVLGFPTEYGSFLSGGGGLFPTVGGTFSQGDLLAISIGGNDARLYERGSVFNGTPGPVIPPGTLAGAPAAGAASAAAATAGLNALVAAGAPTISYLAGSSANLPEIAAQPNPAAAFAIRDAYYQGFDGAMRSTLAGYAANGTIVHYLDLKTLNGQVTNNFAAYGLTSLVCPVPTPSAPGCLLDSSQYLFYVDGLHLTSAGFAIVARYVQAQLKAPLTLQATSDVSLDTAHQWGRTLTSRLDLAAPRDGDQPEGMHVYVVGDALNRSMSARAHADAYRATTKGVTGGVDFGFGSGIAGIAVNYSRPRVALHNDAAETRSRSWQVGGYAGFGLAGGFVQAYVGYGRDRHRITRQGVISDLRADPKGSHYVAGAKAGYLMPFGAVRLGPVVALDYAKVKVDGYTEVGDAALALNVGRVSYDSARGSAGLEARGDFAPGGISVRPYLALTAEKNFSRDDRVFDFSQTSAPVIVNSWDAAGGTKKVYGRLTAGGSAQIFSHFAIDASLSGTTGKSNGNETSAHVGAKIGF